MTDAMRVCVGASSRRRRSRLIILNAMVRQQAPWSTPFAMGTA